LTIILVKHELLNLGTALLNYLDNE